MQTRTRPPVLFVVFLVLISAAHGQTSSSAKFSLGISRIDKRGNAAQLIVDGKPLLLLAGELHNSSSSSVEYMQSVWPRLVAMHLNTVLLPVAWETIEPSEGKFDFAVVDGLLEQARANNMKIVFLWFGAWKNTYSSYVPAWVKRDIVRFPRVQTGNGRDTERLSPFSMFVCDADAHAFASLMGHLREVDSEQKTVLMMQVENEVGVIPESRDHSPVADSRFANVVPPLLTNFMVKHRSALNPEFRAVWETAGGKTAGTWQEIFGKAGLTDDLFMAWQYATYIERVTVAGKAQYPIPMYTNAALIRPNYAPGQYNSGGPLPHSIDVWHAGAPSLDLLAPDIYFNEFAQWADAYRRPDNPLFIPEAQGGAAGAANALFAFGQLSAIAFSAFGIDDQGNAPLDLVGITRPTEPGDSSALSNMYNVLSHLTPEILEKQRSGDIMAVLMEGEAQRSARVSLGEYTATVTRSRGGGARTSVMFLRTAHNEFTLLGSGDADVTFSADTPGPPIVGVESIDEEFFVSGSWVPRRRMNGDESSQGQALKLDASDAAQGKIYKVRLYRYQ